MIATDPVARKDHTMRRTAPALLTALALALAAPAAAETRISIGIQQEPTALDPTVEATAAINVMVTQNIFETLTRVDRSGTVQPSLAESWDISEDGRTYRFHLHEGVEFHDGTPFTADHVLFSFERAMEEGSTNPRRAIFDPIESVEKIDDHTVEVTLARPEAFFLFELARGPAIIVTPETVETNATRPVGTGPFRFDAWTRGDRLRFVKNPDHRNADEVALDVVEFRFIADPASAAAAIMAGELDAFPGFPAPELVAQFEADPRFNVHVGTTEGEVILAMNNARPPFDDIRARQAVSHAIDREELIEGAMYGLAVPISSFYPPHGPAFEDLSDLYPHDPDRARELFEEAGILGDTLTIRPVPFPYGTRSAEIIQAQLGAAGMDVRIENVEWGFWLEEVFRNHNYDLTIVAHTESNDLGNFARDEYYWGYASEEFNELWDAIRAETDEEARNELLRDAQRMVSEEAVLGYLFQLPLIGIFRDGVEGFWDSQPTLALPLAEVTVR
jgi:peptide/nickel transport system substrate-binding protein